MRDEGENEGRQSKRKRRGDTEQAKTKKNRKCRNGLKSERMKTKSPEKNKNRNNQASMREVHTFAMKLFAAPLGPPYSCPCAYPVQGLQLRGREGGREGEREGE